MLTVRGLSLEHLAVRRGEHRRHEPQRAKALCHDVRLHIAICRRAARVSQACLLMLACK